MSRFLFLLGSTRAQGNTELLARAAARGLAADAETRWLRLSELPLEPFLDVRHGGGSYAAPQGPARTLLEATLWATDLVFAAPTYWYGLPAGTKQYLDHWSGWLRAPGVDFKATMAGRRLWVITVNSSEPGDGDDASEPLLGTLRRTAAYMGMAFAGALVGRGNRPGDVERDAVAMQAAADFFRAARRPA
jgi:multimeric flavodoxin WrbA